MLTPMWGFVCLLLRLHVKVAAEFPQGETNLAFPNLCAREGGSKNPKICQRGFWKSIPVNPIVNESS